MDVRLKAAVASRGLNVSAFCREYGISRDRFYVFRARHEKEGLEGLQPRSRAPKSSPQRISTEMEDLIVEVRKELDELGVDHGPGTIQWHLQQRKLRAVPSEATIWRVLTRRGFIVPQPRKRPKSSYRRFEASAPNELWQADCIDWTIATGVVKILTFLDDHSRMALRVKALPAATSVATWEAFCEACERFGVPVSQLSDNGTNFSGRLRGYEVEFERELRAIGVVPRTSRPYHPQTCGKVERFQQTLKKWLRNQPMAADLDELQAQLDWFVEYYNNRRPHRGIGRVTPMQRWNATPPAINLGIALPSPTQHATSVVDNNGIAAAGPYRVGVGSRYKGRTARIDFDDTHMAVFIDHRLVRAFVIDPSRYYQPQTLRTSTPPRQPSNTQKTRTRGRKPPSQAIGRSKAPAETTPRAKRNPTPHQRTL